jgi:hypothetical protein
MKAIQTGLYVFMVLSFCLFLFISITSGNWTWFSRSGSLVAVVPMLISIIEMYSDREQMYAAKHNYARIAPDDVEERAKKYWPLKIMVNTGITIVGTLIWGFGDLIK